MVERFYRSSSGAPRRLGPLEKSSGDVGEIERDFGLAIIFDASSPMVITVTRRHDDDAATDPDQTAGQSLPRRT
jgi:hypothetical protein